MKFPTINWTKLAEAWAPLAPCGVFMSPDGAIYGPDGAMLVAPGDGGSRPRRHRPPTGRCVPVRGASSAVAGPGLAAVSPAT